MKAIELKPAIEASTASEISLSENTPKPEEKKNESEWDGPEDSDEEIAELKEMKLEHEVEANIRFSRKYLIDYIE